MALKYKSCQQITQRKNIFKITNIIKKSETDIQRTALYFRKQKTKFQKQKHKEQKSKNNFRKQSELLKNEIQG